MKWNCFNTLQAQCQQKPGDQEEATDVSCFLVWQRKKPELCIYLANIKQGNIAERLPVF